MTKEFSDTAPRRASVLARNHPMQGWADRLSELELAVLKPLGAGGVALADVWAEMAQEWAGFVSERIRRDARLQHAVLHCRSPQDLPQIYADFMQGAIDGYQAGAGRMVQLAERAARAVTTGASEIAASPPPTRAGHATAI